jgi:hypothetical protein
MAKTKKECPDSFGGIKGISVTDKETGEVFDIDISKPQKKYKQNPDGNYPCELLVSIKDGGFKITGGKLIEYNE